MQNKLNEMLKNIWR